jgi:DNA-binding NtrC family response regulator
MEVTQIKQRFGIIGQSLLLDHAIDTAVQVAPTDLSVLISGESGTGKENMPKIIHQMSRRKHGKYIAVNCGAIPEGTIDSELFGHEKGAFTGAQSTRQGYFEEADGGTIFLDEVAELPLQTQVRLLRVLETGEFIKVGSSKVQKTDVRIVAASNINLQAQIEKGKFREDLFYRLNTVPIHLPALGERREDIHLLFRKFAADFAEKYHMPPIRLEEEAIHILENHSWKGNIRQLKNITEQISIIEKSRNIDANTLLKYLPTYVESRYPAVVNSGEEDLSEREILYKVLFELRNDVAKLKQVVAGLMDGKIDPASLPDEVSTALLPSSSEYNDLQLPQGVNIIPKGQAFEQHEEVEESLSLEEKEIELIKKALEKYRGKRKYAARDLGISERTLYRKIKEYDL